MVVVWAIHENYSLTTCIQLLHDLRVAVGEVIICEREQQNTIYKQVCCHDKEGQGVQTTLTNIEYSLWFV